MRIRLVLSAMVSLAAGNVALADGVRYNYAQAQVLLSQLSQHGAAMNGSGLGLEAAVGIGPYAYAVGNLNSILYSAKLYDVNSNSHLKIKLTPASVGAGIHLPVFSALDVLGGVSLERIKLTFAETGQPTQSDVHEGWGAMLGLRGWFSDSIQWDVGLKYSEVGDLKTIFGYTFSGRYYFKSAYSFGVDINGRLYDDKYNNVLNVNESTVAVVFRYDFGIRY